MRIHLFEPIPLFADALSDVLRARGHEVSALSPRDVDRRRTAAGTGTGDGPATNVIACDGRDTSLALSLAAALAPADVVVLLDDGADTADAAAIERAGARAVVSNAAPLRVLVAVIEGDPAPPLRRHTARSRPAARNPLTRREQQVLEALVAGAGTEDLMRLLGVSASTARTHVQNVMSKLGAHSRLEAVAMAVDRGLVPVRPEPSTDRRPPRRRA